MITLLLLLLRQIGKKFDSKKTKRTNNQTKPKTIKNDQLTMVDEDRNRILKSGNERESKRRRRRKKTLMRAHVDAFCCEQSHDASNGPQFVFTYYLLDHET
jgi:hypothetical protein